MSRWTFVFAIVILVSDKDPKRSTFFYEFRCVITMKGSKRCYKLSLIILGLTQGTKSPDFVSLETFVLYKRIQRVVEIDE